MVVNTKRETIILFDLVFLNFSCVFLANLLYYPQEKEGDYAIMKMEITKLKPIISDIPDATRGHLTRRTIPMRTAGRSPDGLIYILSGSCHYTFDDGTSFGVKENDILYLAAGAKYQMDISCDKYEYYVVNFTLFGNEERQSAVYTPRSAASAEQLFARLAGEGHAPPDHAGQSPG